MISEYNRLKWINSLQNIYANRLCTVTIIEFKYDRRVL